MRRKLGHFLEMAYAQYARAELIASDPLQVPYRYTRKVDKEVAAFIAAGLSFGSVPTILRAADTALAPLGEQPAARLMAMTPRDCAAAAEGFNHRWIFADDMAAVYQMLGGALREAGELEPLFAAGMTGAAEDVRPGLAALNQSLGRHLTPAQSERRGTRYFLSSAQGPGAAKRLHMFTRWMVRSGDVDMGLWGAAKPHQLIVPLDTHVGRIARYIGLTSLKSPGLAMALDITRSLRRVDVEDPVRFDFVLSRLGILGACPRKRRPTQCQSCALFAVCRL